MRVLFFAQLRQVTGVPAADLVAEGVTAGALWLLLLERWPGLADHRSVTRLARNGVYAGADDIFANQDEVALIPPVSGG